MAGNMNNENSTTPTFTPSRHNDGLFSDTEKKQLHSFLDAFATPDGQPYPSNLQTSYNADDKTNYYAPGTASTSSQSPTPVLLSLPYSENGTFGQQPNRKRGNDRGMIMESGSNNNTSMDYKKMRPLPNDTAAPTIEMEPTFIAMDNTPSPSTPTATAVTKSKGSGRGRKPAHELLSDDQKKANHIASEQKRRANIRLGFDQLVGVVPNLTECQRSESLILQKSVDYIRQLVDSKNGLRDRVRELQTALGEVPDEDSSEGEMDYDF